MLGKRVITKKIGPPVIATVTGIVEASFLPKWSEQYHPMYFDEYSVWDDVVPNWRQGQLLILLYDQPIKQVTKKEWEIASCQITGCKSAYSECPVTTYGLHPIEDVEIFDDSSWVQTLL